MWQRVAAGLEVAHLDHREAVAGPDPEQIEARDALRGGLVDRSDLRAHLVVEQAEPPGRIGKFEPVSPAERTSAAPRCSSSRFLRRSVGGLPERSTK
jgi:hypothetical protein